MIQVDRGAPLEQISERYEDESIQTA